MLIFRVCNSCKNQIISLLEEETYRKVAIMFKNLLLIDEDEIFQVNHDNVFIDEI